MSFFLFFEPTSNFPAFPHVPSLHDQGPLDMLYSSMLFKPECLSPRELEKNTAAQVLSYLSSGLCVFALQAILI